MTPSSSSPQKEAKTFNEWYDDELDRSLGRSAAKKSNGKKNIAPTDLFREEIYKMYIRAKNNLFEQERKKGELKNK